MKNLPIKTLSASALNLFLTYPDAYYYRYILKVKEGSKSDKLILGSLLHSGIENILLGKDYVKSIEKSIEEECRDLSKEEKEAIQKETLRLLRMYKKDGPYFEPKTVEQLVKVKLKHPRTEEELPIPWVAKIDLITKDDWVVDHKSTSSELKKLDASYKNQAVAYWMVFKALYGRDPQYFVLNQLIKQKRNPRCRQDFYTFSIDEQAAFFNLVKTVIHKISTNDFWGEPMLKTYYPHPYPELKERG